MKRREFLISTGLVGAIAPHLARSATPCPPPTVKAIGGGSASTSCSAATAMSDWIARSTAPGVVWAHNFISAEEVTKFRFDGIGIDPAGSSTNGISWDGTDGFAGGGNVTCTIPTGGICVGDWMRPFQALPGDIGYTSGPDFTGSASIYTSGNWGIGFYGNAAYHDGSTNTVNGIVTPVWAGTSFYIQFRLKVSASRFTAGNPDGKMVFIGITSSTPDHELVIQSLQDGLATCYTNFGDRNNSALWASQGSDSANPPPPSGSAQAGGAYNCVSGAGCFSYPADTWITVLIHFNPGLNGDNPIGNNNAAVTGGNVYTNLDVHGNACNNTTFQMSIALPGRTSYTQIYNKSDYIWIFDPPPWGWNMFGPTGYMNGVDSVAGWTQKYTQVIFSTQPIACPQV